MASLVTLNDCVGYLDFPTEHQVVCGQIGVEGWVFDSPDAEADIRLEVDGQPHAFAFERKLRPDVERVFPSAPRGRPLGFLGLLDTAGFSDGGHDITCVSQVGDDSTVIGTRRVRVSNTRRAQFAAQFLKGSGIEIGALHNPMGVPSHCKVSYVDRMDMEGLRAHYPELAELPFVTIDRVDDGERLTTFPASSQDFVIANHFLEHTQSPLRTIERHLQVLRPDGVLFMAVPDKRRTFDVNRPVTLLEHIYRDYHEGPKWSYMDHVREWVALVGNLSGEAFDAEVARIARTEHSIHYHVWTHNELLEMLVDARQRLALPYEIEGVLANDVESLVALRKSS